MTNVYTTDEVTCHDDASDLWITIHGNVYDLTSFLYEHPGGDEVLLQLAGQDGTEHFDSIGHSEEALQLQKRYKIGELVGDISKKTNAGVQKTVNMSPNDNARLPKQQPRSQKDSSKLKGLFVLSIILYIGSYFYNQF